jgi:hypothetical protein
MVLRWQGWQGWQGWLEGLRVNGGDRYAEQNIGG